MAWQLEPKDRLIVDVLKGPWKGTKTLKRWANPGLFFIYFHLFVQKIQEASRIGIWIIRVEGENADH